MNIIIFIGIPWSELISTDSDGWGKPSRYYSIEIKCTIYYNYDKDSES